MSIVLVSFVSIYAYIQKQRQQYKESVNVIQIFKQYKRNSNAGELKYNNKSTHYTLLLGT